MALFKMLLVNGESRLLLVFEASLLDMGWRSLTYIVVVHPGAFVSGSLGHTVVVDLVGLAAR